MWLSAPKASPGPAPRGSYRPGATGAVVSRAGGLTTFSATAHRKAIADSDEPGNDAPCTPRRGMGMAFTLARVCQRLAEIIMAP